MKLIGPPTLELAFRFAVGERIDETRLGDLRLHETIKSRYKFTTIDDDREKGQGFRFKDGTFAHSNTTHVIDELAFGDVGVAARARGGSTAMLRALLGDAIEFLNSKLKDEGAPALGTGPINEFPVTMIRFEWDTPQVIDNLFSPKFRDLIKKISGPDAATQFGLLGIAIIRKKLPGTVSGSSIDAMYREADEVRALMQPRRLTIDSASLSEYEAGRFKITAPFDDVVVRQFLQDVEKLGT